MKTKDVCAFRDFDARRILSRSYFRTLKLPAGNDEIILDALTVFEEDDIATAEKKISRLFCLKIRIRRFGAKITEHTKRRVRFITKVVTKDPKRFLQISNRLDELTTKYGDAATETENLYNAVLKLIRRNDKSAQWIYRRQFARNLRKARQKAGMTQRGVALLLDTNSIAISDYERGEVAPSFRNLVRLSDVLHVSIDELIKS